MISRLRQVGVFVTESCNLACGYCFAANMENRLVAYPTAQAALDLVFHESVQSRDVVICFWGGEPLLAFGLIQDLVQYGESRAAQTGKKIRFAIPTNATLLDDHKIDFCIEHEISLSLSLDGLEPAQSLRPTRGKGSSFPLVLSAISLLKRRYGANLPGVRMTVSPSTAGTVHENAHFFFEQGFTHLFFAPVHQASWTEDAFLAYEESLKRLAQDWLERISRGERRFVTNWDKLLAKKQRILDAPFVSTQRPVECGAGSTMVAVDLHGDIYPCHRFVFYDKKQRAHSLGNVLRAEIDHAAMADFQPSANNCGTATQRCDSCPDNSRCLSPCPAVNISLTGSLRGIDERQCRLALIEASAIEHLETLGRDSPAFQEHLEGVAKRSRESGAISAELSTFFTALNEEKRNDIADRAADILTSLEMRRKSRGDGP